MDLVGLLVLVVLYLVILIFGITAAYWFKKTKLQGREGRDVDLVAGRQISGVVGIFTMTATLVGGGYINGTAESVYSQGLVWTLAPIGICLGLIIGGCVFAQRMRNMQYLTMLDPFQEKYGNTVTGLLYIPALCGDIFWSASILAALGTTLSTIIQLNQTISIIISAAIAVLYTMFGQIVSVVYTDILQLSFIVIGLVVSLPFALLNEHVGTILETKDEWLGTIPFVFIPHWIDLLIVMTLGSIPWQSYFQRVLSVRTAKQAQYLSVFAGIFGLILGIPPMLIGVVATNADWNSTTYYGVSPKDNNESRVILPLVLTHLTPRPVTILGLACVASAVMSSIDSAVLSSSSQFTHNIYKMAIRKSASEKELQWIQRAMLLVMGVISSVLAICTTTVYGLFILAADTVFVIMFPQLTCVLFFKQSNSYGAISGIIISVILRMGGGEPFVSLPPLIYYPFYSDIYGQMFPFRTFSAIVSSISIVTISLLTGLLFKTRLVPSYLDIFDCYPKIKNSYDAVKNDTLPQTPVAPISYEKNESRM